MPDAALLAEPTPDRFFDRLPAAVAESFSADQRHAIATALDVPGTRRPPINLRFSVPLPGWRLFLAVVAGGERRSAARRAAERIRHPVRTAGNILFVVAGAMAFYVAALIVFLLWTSVIEF